MIISHISFSQGNHNFILAIITTISIMGMMMMMITVEPSQWGKLTISAGPDKHNIHGNDDVIIIIIIITEEPGQWGECTDVSIMSLSDCYYSASVKTSSQSSSS